MSVTQHTITLGGKIYPYTARAGTIAIENEKGETTCRMFYTAFTLDGANPRTASGDVSLQRRTGQLDDLAAHGLVRPRARASRRCRADAQRTVQSRRESILAARSHRSRLRRCARHRLQPDRAAGQAERFLRRRPGRARIRAVRLALHHDVRSLELAEVSVRRIVRHAAHRDAGQLSAATEHRHQRRRAALVGARFLTRLERQLHSDRDRRRRLGLSALSSDRSRRIVVSPRAARPADDVGRAACRKSKDSRCTSISMPWRKARSFHRARTTTSSRSSTSIPGFPKAISDNRTFAFRTGATQRSSFATAA